jgi:hypothetical protein
MNNSVYSCEALTALPIHASAVQAEGGALLFLGPSETGKSTVRQLLEAHLPALADDIVYLVPQAEGRWGVAPVDNRAFWEPLSASEVAALRIVPLQAVLRLYRAAEPRLERIPILETCRHLIGAFFEVYWPRCCDVPAKKMAFTNLARVAAATTGYHLYFERSDKTVRVLADEFQF